ncbi:flagellar hook-length control protein FliK [Roseibium sp. CAU 1637]|uniref:Flagellar hook-length control protein FliK n=1 Tax=Roseibium limicola TaxID=2816037 RepID=A0A939ELD4_9HYPH|nr:flagellar hook-length control protein FliK [Roseibium limicola]MBO0344714.1 flagellar hook-length control protein FliK [Roseibium limicola]
MAEGLTKQQSSLSGVFAQAAALQVAVSQGAVNVSPPVRQVLQQLLGLRLGGSEAGSVTGEDLQKAVGQTGLASNTGQAAATGGGGGDVKSLLMQLKNLLQDEGIETKAPRPLSQPVLPSLTALPKGQIQQSLQQLIANITGGVQGGSKAGAAGGTAAQHSDLSKQALEGLAKEADSALARIRATQMVTRGLLSDDSTQMTSRTPMDVVMELPLTLGQETAIMQMQIGRDRDAQDEGDDAGNAWRLRFAVDTIQTGTVEASVALRKDGTYISLWLERPDTYDSLFAERTQLEATFANAGMDLQELRFIRGLPAASKARAGARVNKQS